MNLLISVFDKGRRKNVINLFLNEGNLTISLFFLNFCIIFFYILLYFEKYTFSIIFYTGVSFISTIVLSYSVLCA